MSKKCADCGCEVNRNVIQGMYYCPRCDDDKREIDVLPMTVFDRITESTEVLAEKLVYDWGHLCHNGDIKIYWKSTILPDAVFSSKSETIAATVKKLKEVDNGF